jgi:hypothetical protein
VTLRVDLVFFEANEATCNYELAMRLDGQGNGAIDRVEHNTGPDANCATMATECKLPWPLAGEEDVGTNGVVQTNEHICLDTSESDTNCEGKLAYSVVETAEEHYEVEFNNAVAGICEFDVSREIEHQVAGNAAIHINHP